MVSVMVSRLGFGWFRPGFIMVSDGFGLRHFGWFRHGFGGGSETIHYWVHTSVPWQAIRLAPISSFLYLLKRVRLLSLFSGSSSPSKSDGPNGPTISIEEAAEMLNVSARWSRRGWRHCRSTFTNLMRQMAHHPKMRLLRFSMWLVAVCSAPASFLTTAQAGWFARSTLAT